MAAGILASLLAAIADGARKSVDDERWSKDAARIATRVREQLTGQSVGVVIPGLLALCAQLVDENPHLSTPLVGAAFLNMIGDGKNPIALASQVLAVVMREHNIAELRVTCPELTASTESKRAVIMQDGTVEERPEPKGNA